MYKNYNNIWNEFENEKKNLSKEIINEEQKEEKEKQCCDNFYSLDTDGTMVCVNCGVVNSSVVFDNSIFTFQNGTNNMYLRTFTNELYPISSQSTYISGNSKLAKLQSWDSMPYKERVIWEISNELNSRLIGKFSSRIIQDTLFIYKNFYEKTRIYRGENKKGFVAVALYIACSENFAPATPKEISQILDIDLKSIYKCIQKYSEITGHVVKNNLKPIDFVEVFSNKIGLEFKIKKTVIKIIKVIDKYNILGGTVPYNICISTILFVCREMGKQLNIKTISEEFSISLTTLEKTINLINSNKQKIYEILVK